MLTHVLLTVALVLSQSDRNLAARPSQPNIVLILADDLGNGDLSCYGGKDVKTPNIDNLATGGIRFTQFYSNSALCSPTRAALLTGRYPQDVGVWKGVPAGNQREGLGLHPDARLLPQILKQHGYATGMFGKWHLGGRSPNLPNDRGFDEFYGFLGGASRYGPVHGVTQRHNREPFDERGHLTDQFTDRACQFLRDNADRPSFVYLAYNAVHGPVDNGASLIPEYVDRCKRRGLTGQRADYCALAEHMDAGVGRVLATLDELKLGDRTLVIFSSDNGAIVTKWGGSNRPFRGEKGQMLEGGIHLPCIIRWPGQVPAGSVSNTPAASMDLFSTMLEAAGIEPPSGLAGSTLGSVIRSSGTETLPDRYLFFELRGLAAVRHGDWKIVGQLGTPRETDDSVPPDESKRRKKKKQKQPADEPELEHTDPNPVEFELYNLAADPQERKNLAAQQPEVLNRLKSKLLDWSKDFQHIRRR